MNAQQPDLYDNIRRIEDQLGALRVLVESVRSSMVSRTEIEAEDAKRVDRDSFIASMTSVNDRLTRLETGPQRLLGWLSLAISGGMGCLTILIAIAGLIVTYILNHK